ncbi:peptidoglycan-binding protein [Marinibacterium profundimaris]|uniref:peptidoglycan-binding protein n=1 Tax=Marinibacterium profundimaris TaxID=1679460 RepID=UPI000B527270|nr:peptidoglycan-binding protein [Marinibacterium profundimaris]
MIPLDGQFLLSIAPVFSGREALAQRRIVFALSDRISSVLAEFEIDTPLRIAHFMAQITHECAGFRTTQEFADGTAYEGRADLGNTEPGDGPRFKGRGLLQLTGRNNYRRYGGLMALPLEDQPELAADPVTSLRIACVYWTDHDINPLCDADDLLAVTRKVNGRLNGLEDRQACLARAKREIAARWAVAVGAGQAPGPVLHLGSFGAEVERLQRALAARGCPVPVDADFGPATLLAVRQAQIAAGILPDGIVGGRTWDALSERKISGTGTSA